MYIKTWYDDSVENINKFVEESLGENEKKQTLLIRGLFFYRSKGRDDMNHDKEKCKGCLWLKMCDEGHYFCMFKSCMKKLGHSETNAPRTGGGEGGKKKQI